ncbi:MAG: hypothetical protein ACYC4D_05785 [Thermoleophilia bacterium]
MGTKRYRNPVFLLAFFTSLALFAGGCGSSTDSAGAGEAAGGIFGAAADPVTLSVKTDESRKSSTVIPEAGGIVSATAADGTRFTLTIPKDALLSEETISLIPVSSIDGLPLSGGMSAAVQFEPAGLLLFAPATLTIETPSLIPADELVAFGYSGPDNELFLDTYKIDGSRISQEVTHFSGEGIGRGTRADRAAQARRQPSRPADRMNQAEAEAVGDRSLEEAAAIYGHQYYVSTLRPLLDSSAGDTQLLFQAAQKFTSWKKSMEQLNDAAVNDDIREGFEVLKKAIRARAEAEAEGCPSSHAFFQLQVLIKIATMAGDHEGTQFILDKWQQCAELRIEFDSTITETVGPQTAVYHVRSKVDVKPEIDGSLTGSAPLEYVEFSMTGDIGGCQFSTQNQGSAFSAAGVLNLNLNEENQPPPGLRLDIDPGAPGEHYTVTCPGIGVTDDSSGNWWKSYYLQGGSLALGDIDMSGDAGPVEKRFSHSGAAIGGPGSITGTSTIRVEFAAS